MTIDPSSDRALHKQIADEVRGQIQRDELSPGDRIPAESDYIGKYGVSRDTVRQAIAILRNEGLIDTSRRGSHVRSRADLTAVRVDRGQVYGRMPTAQERKDLKIPEGVPLLLIRRAGKQEEIHRADRAFIELNPG